MQIKDTNKLIEVDLSSETIKVSDLPQGLIRDYLGGRGINSYLLYQYTNNKTLPLSKDNALIVGTGLFTGLKGLAFSRTTITAKSPESGLFGDANIGGGFGVSLRKNGYGYIVVKGEAKTPKMIVVSADKVTIKDALAFWGKDTQETQEIIHQSYPNSETLCIGPAGENKVVFACIMNRRKNAAARCGMGAVMGVKKLKAIVSCDTNQELEPEDQEKFRDCLKNINAFLQKEFLLDRLKEYGSSHLFEIVNEGIGFGRVKNGRTLAFPENENISHTDLKKFHTKRGGCQNCIIQCHYTYEYKGIKNEGPEYGVMAHFGPVLGIGRIEASLIINDLINRLGIDASSSANVIAWLIELYQDKVIDKSFTQGVELEWGNIDLIKKLLENTVYRRGLGNLIADGPVKLLEILPEQARNYLCWGKRLVQSEPADLRFIPAFALSNSVASRGSDHLRSRPIWVAFEPDAEVVAKIYGGPVESCAQSYGGKGRVVIWWEHYLAMFDLLGLCKFLGFHSLPPGVPFSFFSELVKTAYGMDLTESKLKEIGERVINIERLYIQREGVGRGEDYPPVKTFKPLKETQGMREEDKDICLNKEKYDAMLDEYYNLRGWSLDGKVSEETKKRLELEGVIYDL